MFSMVKIVELIVLEVVVEKLVQVVRNHLSFGQISMKGLLRGTLCGSNNIREEGSMAK
jgi:hypothetical protein